MQDTPENTAREWRDLADQLTPDDIAELEDDEREFVHALDADHALLFSARRLIDTRLVGQMCADVPAPVGAATVDEWNREGWRRPFFGTQRGNVGIYGEQNTNGTVTHLVVTVGPPGDSVEMDSAGARKLAAATLATADEIDKSMMTEGDLRADN
jgi:hypothetical protein